ncbi:hypothetical protein EDD11_009988 [Mortierella claussenii]|nr:hypothetical protein EDD11_009988 [Mortierella claussenii]
MTSPLARSTSSLSSADMEALFAKIHKDQASQLEMLRHTKRAMDRSISTRDSSDIGAASMASLSFEILGELLDEIVLDVVSEAHRDVKTMRSICPVCKTKCRNYGITSILSFDVLISSMFTSFAVVRTGLDIFGQNPQSNNSQTYDCVHCQRSFPAQRYAPHLEKCLGLSGRSSSRAASRRVGTGERAGSGSPFTPVSYSDDRDASDSDKDLMEKKRKKNASSGSGLQTNGSSALNGGSDYGTPSSVKSSPGSTKVKKQKSDSADYPSKPQKSSLLAKASKGSNATKLKGLGLHTSASVSATPVGEISLGYLDDDLLLANGRSLQNGAGGGSSNGSASSNGHGTPQKLSSSNPKRMAGGISSSKRPPGSGSGASKNGQVASSSSSFFERLKAIGSHDGASSESGISDDESRDDNYRKEEEDKVRRRGATGAASGGYDGDASSQPLPPVVLRLKKLSAFTGHASDTVDADFIDIDGDGDDDPLETPQMPKKKKA